MNLQNKFQQVHGKMDCSLYLLRWLQARPRRFSFKTWADPNADPFQNRPRSSRMTPRLFLIYRIPGDPSQRVTSASFSWIQFFGQLANG